MNNLITTRTGTIEATGKPTYAGSKVSLVRNFIETGDPRCPLAGLWTQVIPIQLTTDEPERTWPAMVGLLLRRAIHPALTLAGQAFA